MSILLDLNDTNNWLGWGRVSTTDIFGESKWRTDIKIVPTKLKLMTNGGLLTTNQQGNLNNDGNGWYHP